MLVQKSKSPTLLYSLLGAVCLALLIFYSLAIAIAAEPSADHNALTWNLNQDVLTSLGVRVALSEQTLPVSVESNIYGYATYAFPIDSSGVSMSSIGARVRSVHGNFLALGGLLLTVGGERVDLRRFHVHPGRDGLTRWNFTGDDQSVWFYMDHAHGDWNSSTQWLRVSHADLRLGRAFAILLGHPELEGTSIGGANFQLRLKKSGLLPAEPSSVTQAACSAPWPNPQNPARIRLLVATSSSDKNSPDTISFERCRTFDENKHAVACVGGNSNGRVVFAPDASLVNVGKSAVPWYGMFTGTFPPYGNDQHPFLIWNLYRADPDGTLRQLGRSGVKHAFYAVNTHCACPPGHVVYPACEDTYSSFSNDSLEFVGPRSEVVPAKGIWGRCGSVFDSDCDNRPGPHAAGRDDGLLWRLSVSERELLPALHPGAKYFFEYGYFVRDRDRTDGAMGFRAIYPQRVVGTNGLVSWKLGIGDLQQEMVLSQWSKEGASDGMTRLSRFRSSDGSGALATRVIKISPKHYRYIYAVLNLDLVHADVSGDPKAPHVSGAHGIDQVIVPRAAESNVFDSKLLDAGDGENTWVKTTSEEGLVWETHDGRDELTWGSVYTVVLDTNLSPTPGNLKLHVGGTGTAQMLVESLLPDHP